VRPFGPALWIVFLVEGSRVYAWIGVALLSVALIGMSMAVIWLRGKAAPAAPTDLPADGSFPLPVVLAQRPGRTPRHQRGYKPRISGYFDACTT